MLCAVHAVFSIFTLFSYFQAIKTAYLDGKGLTNVGVHKIDTKDSPK